MALFRAKDIMRAAVLGLVLTLLAEAYPFFVACTDMSERVMRLHVLADSDLPEAQEEKLIVRDTVLDEAAQYYEGAENMDEASAAVCTHLDAIERAGQKALDAVGGSGKVRATVCEMYFETRDYGDFKLPAGKYRTLRVTIGEGKGKNWWCIVFPELCVPAASKSEEDVLSVLPEDEREIITQPKKYEIRFKIVEWYEELRNFFVS